MWTDFSPLFGIVAERTIPRRKEEKKKKLTFLFGGSLGLREKYL